MRQFILDKILGVEQASEAMQVDMRGSQPSPGNMDGGLSTIAEKSLGAICKSGSRPIGDCLEYAEWPCDRAFPLWTTGARIWLRLLGLWPEVLSRRLSLEAIADNIEKWVLAVARGQLVQAEKLGHREFGFYSIGVTS